jgi:protein-tyrosine phosphatase
MPAADYAIEALENTGIDMRNHKSRQISEKDIKDAYRIFCMTGNHAEMIRRQFPEHRSKVYSVSEYLHSGADVSDPFGMTCEEYKKTARRIDMLCEEIINKLEEE